MSHPIFDALDFAADLRRCPMFWIVGQRSGDHWQPREDLPPCPTQEIAVAFARELTLLTEVWHEARGFRVEDGRA